MGTAGCPDRIANAGCLVTCFAMVLDYYQIELFIPAASSSTRKPRRGMDPGILNDWLRTHGGYGHCVQDRVGNCCLEWENLPREISISTYENASASGLDAVSRRTIDQALGEGHPVVAGVHWGAYCHGSVTKTEDCHWVVITGKSGTTYSIVDPYNRDSRSREGVTTTLAQGVFGSYVIDRFVVVSGPVPTAPRPRVRLEVIFAPEGPFREGDLQRRLVHVAGSEKELLLFARVIDPQGRIFYAHYPTQDSLPTDPIGYSETKKSVYPQARRSEDKNWEWNETVLAQAGTGTWVWEVWVEDPDRPDEPLAYDIAAYAVLPHEAAPGPSPGNVLAVLLAIGLTILLTTLAYTFALSSR